MAASKQISSFDKSNLAQIRVDLNAALAEVAKKYGIEVSSRFNIGFTNDTFEIKKLSFSTKSSSNAGGQAVDPKFLLNMKKHAFKFGLHESDIGLEIVYNGAAMTILGMSGYTKFAVKIGGEIRLLAGHAFTSTHGEQCIRKARL